MAKVITNAEFAKIKKTVENVSTLYIGTGSEKYIKWSRPKHSPRVVSAVIEDSAWCSILNGYSDTGHARKAEEALVNALDKIGMFYELFNVGVMMIYKQ